MTALWLAVVGGVLLAFSLARTEPALASKGAQLKADIEATTFLAYRHALIDYKLANPTVTGTINKNLLTLPWGLNANAIQGWSNTIQGGELYVYADAGNDRAAVLAAAVRKSGYSINIGTKSGTGNLISHTMNSRLIDDPDDATKKIFDPTSVKIDTQIVLPAAIPAGAMTMVGVDG